jgi:hypothetical protein
MDTLLRRVVGWGWRFVGKAGEVHDTPEDFPHRNRHQRMTASSNVIFSNVSSDLFRDVTALVLRLPTSTEYTGLISTLSRKKIIADAAEVVIFPALVRDHRSLARAAKSNSTLSSCVPASSSSSR